MVAVVARPAAERRLFEVGKRTRVPKLANADEINRMSNCVVRSRGSRLPCSVVADHGIEGSDHLSHDGDDNDFGFLVGRGETVVEDFTDGIVPSCAEGSHVEDVTDRHATAIDAAMSFELATVEVVRRKSDEGSDLLAAHLSELWQESDQGEGQ